MEDENKPADQEKKLTTKEENFCQLYLIDFNASKAAREAGYSEDSAASIGSENLRKPHIQQRIKQLREEMGATFNITRERIAQELARIGFFDIRKIHTEDGAIMPVHLFSDAEAAAVAGIEVEEETKTGGGDDGIDDQGDLVEGYTVGRVKKIKIADKRAALESLIKLMGYDAPNKFAFTDPDGNAVPPPVINISQPPAVQGPQQS
jgi:phage terminase small subunit